MNKDAEIRRKILQSLVDKETLSAVAKLVGKPDRQINDMLAGRKSFGAGVARDMERFAIEKHSRLYPFYFEGIEPQQMTHQVLPKEDIDFANEVNIEIQEKSIPEHIRQSVLTLLKSSPPRSK